MSENKILQTANASNILKEDFGLFCLFLSESDLDIFHLSVAVDDSSLWLHKQIYDTTNVDSFVDFFFVLIVHRNLLNK